MNIGIVNPFPFRPHNQNLVFIVNYLNKLKNINLFFAECDGSPKICYNKLIYKKSRSKHITCFACRTFGLKSYLNNKFYKISVKGFNSSSKKELDKNLILSSFFTYKRTETPEEINSIQDDEDFLLLNKETDKFKKASKKWIFENKLDAVIGFNGRIDLVRAVRIACKESSINFLSVEMPWFGKGLLITPNESPSGTNELKKMYNQFKNKPLTQYQIKEVYQPILKRFKKLNKSEYKQFNKDHKKIEWGIINKKSNKKVLFLPSSRSELLGDIKYEKYVWRHPLDSIEYLLNKKMICKDDLIIRFHPIWSQNVFNRDGDNIINYYESFCLKHKIKYIKSEEKIDSNFLIRESDLLIINGSSSFFEGSLIGKPVLSLSKSFYDCSKIAFKFHSKEDMILISNLFENDFQVDKVKIIRKAMRFLYTFKNRFTQFTNNLVYENPFELFCNYNEINNNIIHTCKYGNLISSDKSYSTSRKDEDDFLNNFVENKFDLNVLELIKDDFNGNKILRKPLYRFIDKIYKN